MLRSGNQLRLSADEAEHFVEMTGQPVPTTVEAYNAALIKTSENWEQIGQQENLAEAKFLAAILKKDVLS